MLIEFALIFFHTEIVISYGDGLSNETYSNTKNWRLLDNSILF